MNKKLLLSFSATCLIITSGVKAQVTTPTNNTIIPPQYVGWSGLTPTVKHLDIKNNYAARDINFFVNTSGINGTSTQTMVIKNTTGFVGIGLGAPAFQLDVQNSMNIDCNANAALGFGYYEAGITIRL